MLLKITLQLITTHTFLKIISCMMGFFMWYCVSSSRTIIRTINLPVYFDNIKSNIKIQAPESMQLTLSGTRGLIKASYTTGALHFDSTELTLGKKLLHPTYKNFLLPSAVKVLNCMPIEVSITSFETLNESSGEQ
ncbi:MAG: hypothetical protein K2X90_00720 [Candidatus Babeliaceae bacterium]|nr:hypothetical protein [Candidatus Babeliaceae bacterium]